MGVKVGRISVSGLSNKIIVFQMVTNPQRGWKSPFPPGEFGPDGSRTIMY
jgi:hypothetical protein